MLGVIVTFTDGTTMEITGTEELFYYDETSQCFIVKDFSGLGYFPRENVRLIVKKEPSNAT